MCPYVRGEGRERRLEGTARSALHPFLSSLIINLMRAKAKKKTKNIIAMSAGKKFQYGVTLGDSFIVDLFV